MLGEDILFAFGEHGKVSMAIHYVMCFYEMYWNSYQDWIITYQLLCLGY